VLKDYEVIDLRFPYLNILYVILTFKMLDILTAIGNKLCVKCAPAWCLNWTTRDKELRCATICVCCYSVLHVAKQYHAVLNFRHLRFDTETFNDK